jgi:hypothetical protein
MDFLLFLLVVLTLVISLNSIDELMFVMEGRTEFLNIRDGLRLYEADTTNLHGDTDYNVSCRG